MDPGRTRTRIGALCASLAVGFAVVLAVGPAGASAAGDLPFPADQTFALHSLPGSERTIFLDFGGHVALGTAWGEEVSAAPFDRDGDPTSFSLAEHQHMQTAWMAVAEDCSPFDVNVTTVEPTPDRLDRSDASDEVYGVRVAIGDRTPSSEGASVGLGCTGCFDAVGDPFGDVHAWVDLAAEASAATTGLIATHEAGHTLGLSSVRSRRTCPTAGSRSCRATTPASRWPSGRWGTRTSAHRMTSR